MTDKINYNSIEYWSAKCVQKYYNYNCDNKTSNANWAQVVINKFIDMKIINFHFWEEKKQVFPTNPIHSIDELLKIWLNTWLLSYYIPTSIHYCIGYLTN